MTLIAAVVGGLLIGYFVKDRRRAYQIWIPIWIVVLTFQTIVLHTTEDNLDWIYPFVQLAILAIGLAAVWLGGYIRGRRKRAAAA